MSYQDFDAFTDFMTDWLPSVKKADMMSLWAEVQDALPASVINAAIWTESEFARSLLKQAVYSIGAERMARAATQRAS